MPWGGAWISVPRMVVCIPVGGSGSGGGIEAVGVALILLKRAHLLVAEGAGRLGVVKRLLLLYLLCRLSRLCGFFTGDGASILVSEGSSQVPPGYAEGGLAIMMQLAAIRLQMPQKDRLLGAILYLCWSRDFRG